MPVSLMYTFFVCSNMNTFYIILMFLILNLFNTANSVSKHRLNIILSLDGFHYKFLSRNVTPTLTKLKEQGVSPPYMMNVFPTKTFTNHFSIVTGRYAEEHGVLANKMFNPILNKSIPYSEEMFTFNKTIQPIWALNEIAGNGRHSGVMMWPGCEYKYNGVLPTFVQIFKKRMTFKRRVDKIMKWILHPITPTNLVCIYFDEPDYTGHVYGPDSIQITTKLMLVDNIVKHLMTELHEAGIDEYNLIILSDHGMSNIRYENIINLNEILDENLYIYVGTSPILQIYPKQDKHREVLHALREASNKNGSHFRVFTNEEIPDKWHYKNSPRATHILLLADINFVFSDILNILDRQANNNNISYGSGSTFGSHGYEPCEDEMHPIFIAAGPSFKKNYSADIFNSVDLFSLFASVLELEISPDMHSGTFAHVQNMLSMSVQPNTSEFIPQLIRNQIFDCTQCANLPQCKFLFLIYCKDKKDIIWLWSGYKTYIVSYYWIGLLIVFFPVVYYRVL